MARTSSTIEIGSFVAAHLERRPKLRVVGLEQWSAVKRCQAFAARCGANIQTGGSQPAYDPVSDVIIMPSPAFYWLRRLYTLQTTYAVCILHELAHWTGHRTRQARAEHVRPFDEIYRREECLAEMASALLCHDLGITSRPTLPHAKYLNSYLATLPNAGVELEIALARAGQAVGYLHALARSG